MRKSTTTPSSIIYTKLTPSGPRTWQMATKPATRTQGTVADPIR
jgi:hypothetical protein